ncbi:BgTH12-00326 [Blumeria graminis f. sp. triticale]|uniref:Inositol-pentakisphosphate 2-kinase n=1 Tax=Blumeria graminis f. sp. triticale TaxID=1689686 RepID=A0A9W4D625_BLUGR|nr:BgTH12-00326 [Blumeria graminis f. sp. triticale]
MSESQNFPANFQLEYLNEGAANIVYRIIIPKSLLQGTKDEWHRGPFTPGVIEISDASREKLAFCNKLLRLRKDLTTTNPVRLSQSNWLQFIAPLFHPSELVQQSLVSIKSSGIVQRLNKELLESERLTPNLYNHRAKIRHGVYLADEDYGLLVTNMTSNIKFNTVIEFKPKWLVQSLSAPSDSLRCRQCARNAYINAELVASNEPPDSHIFCPLDFFSEDPNTLNHLAKQILSHKADNVCLLRFVEWIKNVSLLRRLREIQIQFDRAGVLNADPSDKNFLTAMTLRDCTVFVRLAHNEEKIEARLGDLDLKSPAKLSYWKKIECQLIDGGWYNDAEHPAHKQPNNCFLNRKF